MNEYNSKKTSYNVCSNCNKIGHEFRKCPEPITSWGVLLVGVMDDINIIHKNKYSIQNETTNYMGIRVGSVSDINIFNKYNNLINFLLVQRKYSLGYVEFIRGRYIPSNINGITYLFLQMTKEEINNIKTKNFDDLWSNFWNTNTKKIGYIRKEYIESKIKFNKLSEGIECELPLSFYTDKIKPLYNEPEWGIPKGRKNKGESDEECAVREFCEETGYTKQDIKIIYSVKPIVENIIGTNGVSYRHIYYLAELINKKSGIDVSKTANNPEIGSVGLFTCDEALYRIRDYHVEKINIIKTTFLYYVDMILGTLNKLPENNSQENNLQEKTSDCFVWSLENDGF
jgi:8-oxo-dGTP pyrophosphatase MutT (NUDIX family)